MGGIRGQGNVTDSARSSHAASQRKRIRSMEPLNDSAHLTHASTKGGGGVTPTQERALPVCSQGIEEDTPTRERAPPV